jgi:CDP-diglyceride synthetase
MDSGTKLRVLTAAILIPLVIAAIWWGPEWLIAIVTGCIAIMALFGRALGLQESLSNNHMRPGWPASSA